MRIANFVPVALASAVCVLTGCTGPARYDAPKVTTQHSQVDTAAHDVSLALSVPEEKAQATQALTVTPVLSLDKSELYPVELSIPTLPQSGSFMAMGNNQEFWLTSFYTLDYRQSSSTISAKITNNTDKSVNISKIRGDVVSKNSSQVSEIANYSKLANKTLHPGRSITIDLYRINFLHAQNATLDFRIIDVPLVVADNGEVSKIGMVPFSVVVKKQDRPYRSNVWLMGGFEGQIAGNHIDRGLWRNKDNYAQKDGNGNFQAYSPIFKMSFTGPPLMEVKEGEDAPILAGQDEGSYYGTKAGDFVKP